MSKESTTGEPILFTTDELTLLRDTQFFRAKARIMMKMKAVLEGVYEGLQRELAGVALLAPEGFNPASHQFVKGEHLEDFPYQYLDYFKHFQGEEKFTFRTLLWWGHHIVFALILEGGRLALYLGGTPWEWKRGEGYTMELTWERKNELMALLDRRSFVKLARFVPFDHQVVREGGVPETGAATLRHLLPI